jgi:hypothetical protein
VFAPLRLGALGFLALCGGASIASANVIFTDHNFNLAQYSESTQFTSNALASFDQCVNCGNPGTALQTITTAAGGGIGVYAQAFVNNTFASNPGKQGAISGINASVDKDITVSYSGTGFTNTFRPLIEQDGNYYLATIPGPTFDINNPSGGATGYVTISASGLTAANFQEFDFSAGTFVAGNPNFSGDPMLFGLAQITSSAAGGTIEVDLDNLSLNIGVPEPSSLLLVVGGVLSLLVIARIGDRRYRLAIGSDGV